MMKINLRSDFTARSSAAMHVAACWEKHAKIILTREEIEYEQEDNQLDPESTADISGRPGKIELLRVIQKG